MRSLFDLSEESSSSPEDSLAPTSRARDGAWDSSEESAVPYGWRCSGSSVLRDRLSFSLRTFLLSESAGLTRFSMGWRRKATPRGRWWWVLGRSEPRSEGTGSGSLEWPAAQRADGERGSETLMRGEGNPTLLGAAREWSGPRASKRENRAMRATPSQLAGKHGWNLATEAGDPGRRGEEKSSTPGSQPGPLPSLNASWVESLQGAPPGWTELPEEAARELHRSRSRESAR